MGQGYLLKQVLVVAHGGKMQPVFGDAVVRNMMIGLSAVAGQQEKLALFGRIFAVVNFYVAFSAHYVIEFVIAGGDVGAAPASPAPGKVYRKIL